MAPAPHMEENKQLLEDGHVADGAAAAHVCDGRGDSRAPGRRGLSVWARVLLFGALAVALPAAAVVLLWDRAQRAETSTGGDLHALQQLSASHKDSKLCSWQSKGDQTICRHDVHDNTWNAGGTVQKRWFIHNFDRCKQACEDMDECTGVEFHHGWSQHCELWTIPVGHYITHSPEWHGGVFGKFECLSYTCVAKDACGARPDKHCAASKDDCDAWVPDAGHMPNLFPNECGTGEAFDYVLHYMNDKNTPVKIKASTCFKETTLFDTTISAFDASTDSCEKMKCNDDWKSGACHQQMCVKQDETCIPGKWLSCCSELHLTVAPNKQLLIVVSSYHAPLVPFKADKPAGFELKVTLE